MKKTKMRKSSLEKKKSDFVASMARVGLGAVPFAGSLLSEVATNLIPNQRMDRLVNFAKKLEEKFKKLKKSFIRLQLTNENFVDILEKGMMQAAKSLNEERREYIASVIANGLSDKEIKFSETRRILKLLGELNDPEIILLRYYLVPTLGGDEKFRAKHKNIIKVQQAVINSPQTIKDKRALHESYVENLCTHNLLKKEYSVDITDKIEYDKSTKAPKIRMYNITSLGKLFLRQIGLA